MLKLIGGFEPTCAQWVINNSLQYATFLPRLTWAHLSYLSCAGCMKRVSFVLCNDGDVLSLLGRGMLRSVVLDDASTGSAKGYVPLDAETEANLCSVGRTLNDDCIAILNDGSD